MIGRGWDKVATSQLLDCRARRRVRVGSTTLDFISFYSPTQLCRGGGDEIEF